MHVVFSTKERRKMIPTEMKERLWSYTAGICKHQKVFVHAIGGMEDHIHLLLQFPATIRISEAIKTIKANSSGWMSDEIGMASGIRRVQCEQVKHCGGRQIHSKPGAASPENDI
jgi:putative transposase